jgi:arginase
VHVGCRNGDTYLAEASSVIAQVIPASQVRRSGAADIAASVLAPVDRDELDGYWPLWTGTSWTGTGHCGPGRAGRVLATVDRDELDGYWLHLDVDILDRTVMPAVDSLSAGGLDPSELTGLLGALAPRAIGAQVTVFDPDLDPDGGYASLLTEILATGLEQLGQQRMARTKDATIDT